MPELAPTPAPHRGSDSSVESDISSTPSTASTTPSETSVESAFVASLLQRNESWAQRVETAHPNLFPRNGKGQNPTVLWIGCSDSRAGESCLDILPGEVFVHRNIANLVPHGDISSLSVVHFAVDVLKVKHIVVCGHYDCGGATACLTNKRMGLLDNWLKTLREVRVMHKHTLQAIADPREKLNKFIELNVVAQVHNVCRMSPVVDAVKEGRLTVSGLVYDVGTGRLKTLSIPEDTHADDFVVYDNDENLE
ncbi:carbonic anhydrase [Limtongia smithiae]|uniref:carbonic anhydrase n=1 Tax=Limtongia smithiae TaxID=1125753 RepID=UPI0034CF7400